MKFTNLEIDNFMSVSHIETSLNDRGLVLIQGENEDATAFASNGAGKSTIFSESLVWCLFGETIRGLKGNDIVKKGKKNTRVQLEIDEDGTHYTIIRYRKHKEYKNAVRVLRNDKEITAKSDNDTNILIQSILQIDYLSFTNSILFGQGMSRMFASSTDSEQKRILECMLHIDIFKSCQDRAKEKVNDLNTTKREFETLLETSQRQKKVVEDTIEDLQKKDAELGKKVQQKIQELEKQKSNCIKELEMIEDPAELLETKKLFTNLKDKVDKELEGYKLYEDSKLAIAGDIRLMQRDIKSIEIELQDNKNQLAKLLKKDNTPKVCELCGQPLPLENQTRLQSRLEDSIKTFKEQLEEKVKTNEDNQKLLNNIDKMLQKKTSLDKQKQKLLEQLGDINASIKYIEDRRKSVEMYISSINHQIDDQKELLDVTYTKLIEDNIKKAQELTQKIREYIHELEGLDVTIELHNFWVNAFSNQGIKSILLDSVTPFLNQRANYYLQRLSDSSIEVIFTTQTELKSGEKRDKFSVQVINETGDDDYKGNSGGERRRADIAINMALQDLVQNRSNKQIDLVVYDEAFDGLDDIGCEAVIELLHEKAKNCGSVLVITHNESLKGLFDKSLIVCKHNAETIIKEDTV